MNHDNCTRQKVRRWRTPTGLACLLLLVTAAAWLLIEHWVHAQSYLPFLLLAACPLLHVFGHGHGGYGHGTGSGIATSASKDDGGTKSG